jgi:hypothetical protein
VHRRATAAAGVAVLILAALTATACTGGRPAPAPSASPTPSAHDALVASAQVLTRIPYDFSAADGTRVTVRGSVLPVEQRLRMDVVQRIDKVGTMTMQILMAGPENYVRVSVPGLTLPGTEKTHGRWLHVDPARMGGVSQGLGNVTGSGVFGDPFDVTTIVERATGVERVDATHFTGTADLTQVDSMVLDADLVKRLGGAASAVPFEATLDMAGRLSSLTVDLPAAGGAAARTVSATFSAFDHATVPQPPAPKDVMEAPDAVYKIFTG